MVVIDVRGDYPKAACWIDGWTPVARSLHDAYIEHGFPDRMIWTEREYTLLPDSRESRHAASTNFGDDVHFAAAAYRALDATPGLERAELFILDAPRRKPVRMPRVMPAVSRELAASQRECRRMNRSAVRRGERRHARQVLLLYEPVPSLDAAKPILETGFLVRPAENYSDLDAYVSELSQFIRSAILEPYVQTGEPHRRWWRDGGFDMYDPKWTRDSPLSG